MKSFTFIAMISISSTAMAWSLFGPSKEDGPSKKEIAIAREECPKFFKKNFEKGNDSSFYSYLNKFETEIFDIYKKKGKIVAEVGYRERSYHSYSVRLCIIDFEKGSISSPSPLNSGQWSK
jgi:hypothetical protein